MKKHFIFLSILSVSAQFVHSMEVAPTFAAYASSEEVDITQYIEGFSFDTLIRTPNGYINIQDLNVGDEIMCKGVINRKIDTQLSHVIAVILTTVSHYMRICMSNNEKIDIAPGQSLYIQEIDTWIKAKDLPRYFESLPDAYISVEKIDSPLRIIQLVLTPYHNFYASLSNILVRSKRLDIDTEILVQSKL